MAKKAENRPSDDEMTGTLAEVRRDRKAIPAIEGQISRCKKKRVENAEITQNLDTELQVMEFKLYELMNEHRDTLAAEEDGKGNKLRVYRNGDYYAAIKDKETLLYDITKERSAKA